MKEVIVRLTSDHIKVKGAEYVQDLVRCQDCKHWVYNFNGCSRNPCTEPWYATDFCNYGERNNGKWIDADALKEDVARLHVLNDEAEIRRAADKALSKAKVPYDLLCLAEVTTSGYMTHGNVKLCDECMVELLMWLDRKTEQTEREGE